LAGHLLSCKTYIFQTRQHPKENLLLWKITTSCYSFQNMFCTL